MLKLIKACANSMKYEKGRDLMRQQIKKIISIACSVALLAGMIGVRPIEAVGADSALPDDYLYWFEPDTFYTGNAQGAGKDYYSYAEETDTFTRNDTGGWQDYNVAFLYKNQKYKEFALDFDVKMSEDSGLTPWIWIQFGKQTLGQTTNKDAADGAVLTSFLVDKKVQGRLTKYLYTAYDKGRDWWGGHQEEGFDAKQTHHVRVLVNESSYSVIVDNFTLIDKFALPENYKEGYVGIGTGCSGTSYSNVKIDTQNIQELFEGYSPYRTESLDTFWIGDQMRASSFDTDWQYSGNGMITRKSNGGIAALYSEVGYNELDMEFDFTTGDDADTIYIGVGASEVGGDWCRWQNLANPSPTIIRIHGTGEVQYAPTNEGKDWWFGNNSGKLYTDKAAKGAVHKAKISVVGNTVSVTLDGKSQGTITMQNYDGGYIFIAGTSSKVSFSVPKITALSLKNDFSDFVSYFSENIRFGDSNQKDMTECRATDYWTENDGIIIRKGVPNADVQDDLYMAELFYKKQAYTDFELNVDITVGNSGWQRAFVGFGAELGKHFQQPKGGTMIFLAQDVVRYGGCLDGKNYTEGEWGKLNSEDLSKPVHVRIVVLDRVVSVYVGEQTEPTTFSLSEDYKGGYIFLASNSTGSTYANLSVEEIQSENTSDFTNFTGYYSPNITYGSAKAKNLVKTDPQDYWTENKGVITRRAVNTSGDVQDDLYMAELFYDKQKYTNFELNVDVQIGNNNWSRAFVGFGAKMGRHFQQSNGGAVVYLDGSFLRYGGCLNGSVYSEGEWGKQHDADLSKPVHIRLIVMDRVVTVYVGNQTEPTTFSLSDNFKEGGYIFFASNSTGASFSNFSVKAIKNQNTNDFSNYVNYYSENITYGSSDAVNLVERPAEDYWTESNGTITRRAVQVGGDAQDDLYMAELFYNKQQYQNFEMELDVKLGTSNWRRAFVGFGAEKGRHFQQEGGGYTVYLDGSFLRYGGFLRGGTYNEGDWGQEHSEDTNGFVHLRIMVLDGVVNVYVGQQTEPTTYVLPSSYKGGYIFFASNSTASSFANIKITELPDASGRFAGYDEWYAEDISTGALQDVAEGTNWAVVNGIIIRKSVDEQYDDSMNKYAMAYLYFTDQKYVDFKMELDYKHGKSGWARSPVGFGAEIGQSFMHENGGITVFSQPDGTVHMDGNIIENGKFEENVFWPSYNEEKQNITTISPYDANEWHHLIIEVSDGILTAQFDDFPYYYEMTLPSTYNGGYLYLCSNSNTSQYKNIQITDLNAVIDAAAQAGWQPTEKERAYDFGYRDFVAEVKDWIFKKLFHF